MQILRFFSIKAALHGQNQAVRIATPPGIIVQIQQQVNGVL
jgi:hypothetical protein